MAINIPVVNAAYPDISGLQLQYIGNTTFKVLAGRTRNSSNLNDIIVSSDVTVDFSVNGINGLDTGSIAASTFYYVYAVGDSTLYNADGAIASLADNVDDVTIPRGYDMANLAGYVLTDGSSHIRKFYVTGNGHRRTMWYDAQISELSAGTATTFTDVDLATSVPSIATDVILEASITPATADNQLKLRINGGAAANGQVQLSGVVAAKVQVAQVIVPCDSGAVIEYLVSNGSDAASLSVIGYYFDV